VFSAAYQAFLSQPKPLSIYYYRTIMYNLAIRPVSLEASKRYETPFHFSMDRFYVCQSSVSEYNTILTNGCYACYWAHIKCPVMPKSDANKPADCFHEDTPQISMGSGLLLFVFRFELHLG
jgi:hypothetical protein